MHNLSVLKYTAFAVCLPPNTPPTNDNQAPSYVGNLISGMDGGVGVQAFM